MIKHITNCNYKSISLLILFFIFGIIGETQSKEEIIAPNYRVELRDISVCIAIDVYLVKHHNLIAINGSTITGYDFLASYERDKMIYLEKTKNEIIIPWLLNKNENKDILTIMASTVLTNTIDKLNELSENIKLIFDKDLMIISDDCDSRYNKLNNEYTY